MNHNSKIKALHLHQFITLNACCIGYRPLFILLYGVITVAQSSPNTQNR